MGLAIVQAYGIAVGLESMRAGTQGAVIDPGYFFRLVTVVTLVGGTVFLMWLGEQITARGIGNGTSLIIFSGIVANLPHALAATLELAGPGRFPGSPSCCCSSLRSGSSPLSRLWSERSDASFVQYPKRQVGNACSAAARRRICRSRSTLRGDPADLRLVVAVAAGDDLDLEASNQNMGWLGEITAYLGLWPAGLYRPLHRADRVLLLFYTAIVFNLTETADNLRNMAGSCRGIRPGKNTADYLDFVLTRLTAIGAAYLAAVCILPEILISAIFSVPFYFGGDQPVDRRQRDDGHGGANPFAPPRAPVRGADQEVQAAGTPRMNRIP